jgi:hypothetical protein
MNFREHSYEDGRWMKLNKDLVGWRTSVLPVLDSDTRLLIIYSASTTTHHLKTAEEPH